MKVGAVAGGPGVIDEGHHPRRVSILVGLPKGLIEGGHFRAATGTAVFHGEIVPLGGPGNDLTIVPPFNSDGEGVPFPRFGLKSVAEGFGGRKGLGIALAVQRDRDGLDHPESPRLKFADHFDFTVHQVFVGQFDGF